MPCQKRYCPQSRLLVRQSKCSALDERIILLPPLIQFWAKCFNCSFQMRVYNAQLLVEKNLKDAEDFEKCLKHKHEVELVLILVLRKLKIVQLQ